MKIFKIVFILVVSVILLYLIIFYAPVIFINKEGNKCLVDTNCLRISPICEDINKSIYKNDFIYTEPMCINWSCRCEWIGNLLHLKN